MYSIGDKISYPMHGAGIVEAIEDKEVMGEVQRYYVIKMSYDNMTVMLPTKPHGAKLTRYIISTDEAEKVLEYFSSYQENVCENWNKRYRENVDRIKSGDIYEVAQVVKTLMCRDKLKGLSSSERKMLSSAKHILISELILAKNCSKDEMEQTLIRLAG